MHMALDQELKDDLRVTRAVAVLADLVKDYLDESSMGGIFCVMRPTKVYNPEHFGAFGKELEVD